jgi:inorganic pyrophosphatase
MRTIQTLLPLLLVGLASCASPGRDDVVGTMPDAYTLVTPTNLLADHAPRNDDGTVNVVVEIPAGTSAKWEVDKDDGVLRWELENGKPRIVQYLAYPANYGMVPRTLLAEEDGGDGDPLDVVVLGDALPRGAVVRARLVGVLRLLDGGEQDDKLVAVQEGSALAAAQDLAELEALFPGVTTILETWFSSYKGPGEMEAGGWGDAAEAERILESAARSFPGAG